jgi:hypothetical protein
MVVRVIGFKSGSILKRAHCVIVLLKLTVDSAKRVVHLSEFWT